MRELNRERERHRGVYKRRDMEREGLRELDIEIDTVGCTKGEIWREKE